MDHKADITQDVPKILSKPESDKSLLRHFEDL